MEFNTGTGGTGDAGGSPPGPGGPSLGASGSAASAEFRYTDPVQTFIATVQGVVLQPVSFFRGILRQGDFVNPLIFAIVCYEVSAILGGLLHLVGIGRNIGFGGFISSIILAPIIAAIGLFIGAGIIHLRGHLQGSGVLGGDEPRKLDSVYRWDTQPVRHLPGHSRDP